MKLPHIIAICGHPGSGKTEVQKFLREEYGVIPVDDAEPLRRFAMDNLGMSFHDVATQQGKNGTTEILDMKWVNRTVLGMFGAALEELFGDDIMPWMATRTLDPAKSYSFGSVRMRQGHFYRRRGGMVLEVIRPGVRPSENHFDQYDARAVTHAVINSGGIGRLHDNIRDIFGGHCA